MRPHRVIGALACALMMLAPSLALAQYYTQVQPQFVAPQYAPSGITPCTDAISSARATNCTLTPIAGRPFNITVSGTFVGGFQLERSFDNGVTFVPLTAAGTQLYVWSAPESESAEEDEASVQYRVRVTSYTSGTINVRISQ